MPLRLIQVEVPGAEPEEVRGLEEEHALVDLWVDRPTEERIRIHVLARAEQTEPILDELRDRYGGREGFRVLLLPVEASVPTPQEEEAAEEGPPESDEGEEQEEERPARISREELHAQLHDAAELDVVYLLLIALSAVVCAFGLLSGDVAVIIGAMVIAPLLGPLVALSLAATLADGSLAFDGFRSGTAGIVVAFVLSVGVGTLVSLDPSLPEIASRTAPDLGDVGLALAAGSAGTLAFTTGAPAAVIGVMVAVALIPPLVASGLLLGSGHYVPALGAAILTLVNLICVNLAGVVTFLAQGVRPGRWWEAERARKSTALAVAVWTILLLALVAVILWTPAGQGLTW